MNKFYKNIEKILKKLYNNIDNLYDIILSWKWRKHTMEEIVNEMISHLKIKEKLIGILVYGSYAVNMQDEYSDIDILIVIDDKNIEDCGRGIFYYNNKEIEYFIETESNIYKGLMNELDSIEPLNRNRFLTGKIIRDKDEKLKYITERAEQMQFMPYTQLSEKEKILNSIIFEKRMKSLKRKYNNHDLDTKLYYYDYLKDFIKFYYRLKCKPFLLEKFYRSLIDNDYRKINFQYDIDEDIVKKGFIKLLNEINIEELESLLYYILKEWLPNGRNYRMYY
mgnify:FL=1